MARDEALKDDGVGRAWISVGLPILGLIFIVIMLAVATLAGFAKEHDRAYVESTQRLMTGSVEGRAQTLSGIALDYGNWEQAYQSITVRWDPSWVGDNFYSAVADGMVLFRHDGVVRYSWFSDDYAGQAADVRTAAIVAARAIPNLRGLPAAPTLPGTVARTVTRLDGQLVIIAVAAVTQEDDAARLARAEGAPADFLAVIDVVDGTRLTEVGRSLDLADLRFVPTVAPAGDDLVQIPMADASGRVIGSLQWRHAHPGPVAFSRQIWPVIIGLLSIGALAILVARLLVTHQVRTIASARAALDSSQAKSDFLARVSHELRTPLNAVIGYAEMIQEDAHSAESRADAGRIVAAARHLSHLLNDIIDQSRLDSGRIRLNCEVLPVAGMLAEAQGLLAPAARNAGVSVTVTSSALAHFVYADHIRLRQCLLNLIGNAIKFSPKGAVVTVRARLESSGAQNVIVFDVIDNGLGIAKSEQAQIFRPFGQANPGICKTFGGTGLGLSISRDLAREMGGDITVTSELGEGSTFSLSIPASASRSLRAA